MAKATENPRSAEQLKEVAIFLKQADKLVREGSFAAALDEISKARARDPRNLYALAYEERVRSLVASQKERKPDQGGAQPRNYLIFRRSRGERFIQRPASGRSNPIGSR